VTFSKSEGLDQQFTLKIAAAQGFCAEAEAVAFLPLYSGEKKYFAILRSSLSAAVSVIPSMVEALGSLSVPSLSWPALPEFDQGFFNLSLVLAALSYLMLPCYEYYCKKNMKEWGKDMCFPMEEVILEKGDTSDDLGQRDTQKVECRTRTGRYRLQKYWHPFRSLLPGTVKASNLRSPLSKRKCKPAQSDKSAVSSYLGHSTDTEWNIGEQVEVKSESESDRAKYVPAVIIGKHVNPGAGPKSPKENAAARRKWQRKPLVLPADQDLLLAPPSADSDSALALAGPKSPKENAAARRKWQLKPLGPPSADSDGYEYEVQVTHQMRIWHPGWILSVVLARVAMSGAATLSLVQQLMIQCQHYSLYLGESKEEWTKGYTYVTTSTVLQFVKDNPRLKVLHVSGCKNLAIAVVDAVGRQCAELAVCNASSCGFTGIGAHPHTADRLD
jgi:hypothetical protein